MEPFGTAEVVQGPGSEVKAYIEQEWTSEGLYCRSENPETGMFEIVLPQICKDYGEFMQDLMACGVTDIEFRADSKETRLLVYVNDSNLIPEYFKRRKKRTWTIVAMIFALIVLVAMAIAMARSGSGGPEL